MLSSDELQLKRELRCMTDAEKRRSIASANVQRNCFHCRTSFKALKVGHIYCSRECSRAARSVAPRSNAPTKRCTYCGTSITVTPSHQDRKFCNRSCMVASRTLLVTCPGCGDTFKTPRHGPKKTCSEACRRSTQWASRRRANYREIQCRWCGDSTVTRYKSQRFCSRACANAWQGRHKTLHLCKMCKTEFRWSPSRAASAAHNITYCSMSCRDKDPERESLLLSMRVTQNRTATPTAPERNLYAILDGLAVEWERQYLFAAKFMVDAAIPHARVVIQADGNYWHGKGVKDADMHPRVLKRVKYDRSQDAYMSACGWTVLRFWEDELAASPESVAEEIRQVLLLHTG